MPSDLQVDNIKDVSATKTLATLSSSAVTLHSDVTAQAGSGFLNKISNSSSSSATTSVAFDNTKVTTSYKFYQIIIDHIIPTTDARHLYLGLSYDNGSNFFSGIYCRADYRQINKTGQGGVGQEGPQNVDYYQIATSLGNDANKGLSAKVNILGTQCTDSAQFRILSEAVGKHDSEIYCWQFGAIGEKSSNTANYFKIYYSSSSTIAEHDITLYGVS